MFFFYGIRNTAIATAPLPGLACANCHTPEALTGIVFSRYLHLFWIPAFALGKSSVTTCYHCKQTLTTREMPANYRAPVQALQQQASTPLTHFALLLLFGAVMTFGLVMSMFGNSNYSETAATAASPTTTQPGTEALPGTRYKISLAEGGRQYLLAQVTKTTSDSVYFRLTRPLRAEFSDAGATLALRDSVDPGNANQRLSTLQWQQSTTGQGVFKKID